MFDALKDQSSE